VEYHNDWLPSGYIWSKKDFDVQQCDCGALLHSDDIGFLLGQLHPDDCGPFCDWHQCRLFKSYRAFLYGIIFSEGINTGLSAMYLNEIAPINLRGAIGCIEQLFGIFGILFSQIIGLPFFLGSESDWHYIFYIPLVIFL
jgi:hypothetical protein